MDADEKTIQDSLTLTLSPYFIQNDQVQVVLIQEAMDDVTYLEKHFRLAFWIARFIVVFSANESPDPMAVMIAIPASNCVSFCYCSRSHWTTPDNVAEVMYYVLPNALATGLLFKQFSDFVAQVQ